MSKEIREMNKKYLDLFEEINLINSRFANMYLTITENKKNIREHSELLKPKEDKDE